MDMLPPQAPPAHVAQANQAALDTLQRLAETQAWLVAQQDALPAPPATKEARDLLLADLDAFWAALVDHAPGTPAMPRRRAFALRLAQATRDDASLRRNDGTFPDDAIETVSTIALHGGGPLPAYLHAQELLVGEVPYAGALVLSNDREPGRVLLFTGKEGWQIFDSLDALYRDVEWRMRAQMVSLDELPGIAADDLQRVLDTPFLGARAIEGDVFETLTARLVARQREQVMAAFAAADDWRDRLHLSLDPASLLDVHAIVRQRDLALAARRDEERLAVQPAHVRDHWQQAALEYRDRWRLDGGDVLLPSLGSFAETALGDSLRARGIDAAPHDLTVRLTRRVPDAPLSHAISGFPHEDLSLAALAYRNLGSLPTEHLEVFAADGSARSNVPVEALRDIVRDLDLPNAYARHLDQALGNSPAGRERRSAHHRLLQARMRFEAADARLAYYDASEPRSFQDDHQERGFQWVEAVLDDPAPVARRTIDGHRIVVYQLTYKGAPLAGVFMITARQAGAVRRVVLYTPDAPDGRAFREFGDRAELTRDFLLDPRFEAYLLDRLPAAFAAIDGYGQRHFKVPLINGGRDWQWVFGIEGCESRARCTQLEERFEEREVAGSFLDAAYDTALNLAKRNANDLTRSTAATDWDSVFDIWGWNVPFHLAKELVVGTVQSVPRAAQSGWRFYDEVKSGDGLGAYLAFVDGYTSALNVLPLYTQVPSSAGTRMRAAPGSRTLAPTHRTVPAPDTLFEKRFLARGVAAPSGKPPSSGVFTIDGNRYIRQGGKMYHVQFDSSTAGWRLNRPGALDARFPGPAIERLADGQWHFRRVGLAGGSGRGSIFARLMEEVKEMLDADTHITPQVAALTDAQRVFLIESLRQRLPLTEFVSTLRAKVDMRPHPYLMPGARALEAWDEALRVAQATPPTTRTPTLTEWLSSLEPLDVAEAAIPGPSHAQPASSRLPAAEGTGPAAHITGPSLTPLPTQSRSSQVAVRDWPDVGYIYLPPNVIARASGPNSISLPQVALAGSVQGIAITVLPPETPWHAVMPGENSLLPRTIAPATGSTVGSNYGAWVRVNMQMLLGRRQGRGHYPFRLFKIPETHGTGYFLRPVEQSQGGRPAVFSKEPVTLMQPEFEVGFHTP
jgi:hypothetical protein